MDVDASIQASSTIARESNFRGIGTTWAHSVVFFLGGKGHKALSKLQHEARRTAEAFQWTHRNTWVN